MRATIGAICVAAVVLPTSVSASQWKSVSVGHDDAGKYIILADRQTIRTNAPNHREVWIEMVRANPSARGDLFTKQLDEVDCKGRRSRALSISAYSDQSEIIYQSEGPGVWQAIPPDSFGESELNAVCIRFPDDSFTLDDPVKMGRALLLGKDPFDP